MAGGRRATSLAIGRLLVVVYQVHGIALHAWLARRSKKDESFYVRACSHECLGTISLYPDNIATGTLFTYNEMHIVIIAAATTAAASPASSACTSEREGFEADRLLNR